MPQEAVASTTGLDPILGGQPPPPPGIVVVVPPLPPRGDGCGGCRIVDVGGGGGGGRGVVLGGDGDGVVVVVDRLVGMVEPGDGGDGVVLPLPKTPSSLPPRSLVSRTMVSPVALPMMGRGGGGVRDCVPDPTTPDPRAFFFSSSFLLYYGFPRCSFFSESKCKLRNRAH